MFWTSRSRVQISSSDSSNLTASTTTQQTPPGPLLRVSLRIHRTYTKQNRFTALWISSGTTWVSWYQKKHSPTHTHRGHQSSLSASSIYYDPWHPPYSIHVLYSLFPQSLSKFSKLHVYSTYTWNEKQKNRILLKNKECLFFLLTKIYQLPEYYMIFARKILFLPNLGGNCPLSPPPSPMPMIHSETMIGSAPSLRLSLRKNGDFSVSICWTVFVLRFSDRWLGHRGKFWQNWSILWRDGLAYCALSFFFKMRAALHFKSLNVFGGEVMIT